MPTAKQRAARAVAGLWRPHRDREHRPQPAEIPGWHDLTMERVLHERTRPDRASLLPRRAAQLRTSRIRGPRDQLDSGHRNSRNHCRRRCLLHQPHGCPIGSAKPMAWSAANYPRRSASQLPGPRSAYRDLAGDGIPRWPWCLGFLGDQACLRMPDSPEPL